MYLELDSVAVPGSMAVVFDCLDNFFQILHNKAKVGGHFSDRVVAVALVTADVYHQAITETFPVEPSEHVLKVLFFALAQHLHTAQESPYSFRSRLEGVEHWEACALTNVPSGFVPFLTLRILFIASVSLDAPTKLSSTTYPRVSLRLGMRNSLEPAVRAMYLIFGSRNNPDVKASCKIRAERFSSTPAFVARSLRLISPVSGTASAIRKR